MHYCAPAIPGLDGQKLPEGLEEVNHFGMGPGPGPCQRTSWFQRPADIYISISLRRRGGAWALWGSFEWNVQLGNVSAPLQVSHEEPAQVSKPEFGQLCSRLGPEHLIHYCKVIYCGNWTSGNYCMWIRWSVSLATLLCINTVISVIWKKISYLQQAMKKQKRQDTYLQSVNSHQ